VLILISLPNPDRGSLPINSKQSSNPDRRRIDLACRILTMPERRSTKR